ncbi:MAG TPA: hypothetical protein VFB16_04910 [Bauldia sp.]|nr:hypothetical protein [Bauldia sp.]
MKPALAGAAGGAIILAVLGFTWGGWITGSSADLRSKTKADAAVIAALVPICVKQFNGATDAAAKLEELKKAPTYERGAFIEKGGWATMPGSDAPVSGVGRNCAELLTKSA